VTSWSSFVSEDVCVSRFMQFAIKNAVDRLPAIGIYQRWHWHGSTVGSLLQRMCRRGDICARADEIVPLKELGLTRHNAGRRGTITVTIMCVSATDVGQCVRRPTSNSQSTPSAACRVIRTNICTDSIVLTASVFCTRCVYVWTLIGSVLYSDTTFQL